MNDKEKKARIQKREKMILDLLEDGLTGYTEAELNELSWYALNQEYKA